MHQLVFATVHGLYRERYAFREYMTDVVVQNMVTEQKTRIKCGAYVKKISVYKDRLAVQLPERLYIYELTSDELPEMRTQRLERLSFDIDCNMLVVVSNNFLICVDQKLQLFTFTGVRMREWVMESTIRYIKPVGGPAGREGLIVGCEDGAVVKVFIDNPFSVPLVKHKASVRALDLSMHRDQLAVVDEHSSVSVYDLATGSHLYEEPNAEAVAWNTELPDMLTFSAHGTLSIKTGSFPVHSQRMQGVVVGFKGARIYALNYVALTTVDVPQSASLYRFLEKRDFAAAYRIACLGVTDSDWRQLAHDALKALNLDIARRAYVRLKDTRYIELVGRIEAERRQAGHDDQVLIATVLAHQGKFQEAAKLYCKANRVERAIEMFSDLRKWEEARQYAHTASGESAQELVRRQAMWAEQSNDMSAAYSTYLQAGETLKAIQILGTAGWTDKLIEVARGLSSGQTAELRACLPHFEKHGASAEAKEVLLKLGDTEGLLQLHLNLFQWTEALALIEEQPQLAPRVYLPYAQWLIEQDRFEEAQAAFKQAGHASRSLEMLRTLTHNAVLEHRYNDAGQYLWSLAKETLATAPDRPSREVLEEFDRCRRTAEQYYAYHSVHKYTDEPFTALTPDTVFNIARTLLAQLLREAAPYGISKAYCLFALAKQAKALGANKLARFALERLQTFKVPIAWQEQVDLFALTIRSRPPADADELQPSCFRCQTINPLLNQQGDRCTACGHAFIRSFVNFELLPLVRFQPSRDITQLEALTLLRREPPPRKPKRQQAPENPWANDGPDVQTLSLAGNTEAAEQSNIDIDEPFTKAMLDFEPTGRFMPTVATREMLLQMDASEVYVVQWGTSARPTEYYRNMLPDVPVVLCHNCNHFFHEEDWEFATMSKGVCPFCRSSADGADAGTVASFPPARGAGAATPTGAMAIQ
jgi:intraflagellar transport protein 122